MRSPEAEGAVRTRVGLRGCRSTQSPGMQGVGGGSWGVAGSERQRLDQPPKQLVGSQGGCQTRSPFLGFGGWPLHPPKTTSKTPHSASSRQGVKHLGHGTSLESWSTSHPRQPGRLAWRGAWAPCGGPEGGLASALPAEPCPNRVSCWGRAGPPSTPEVAQGMPALPVPTTSLAGGWGV